MNTKLKKQPASGRRETGTVLLIKRLLIAVAALTLANSARASSNSVYHYEPAKSELAGVVEAEGHYGPPTYGENPDTDRVENIYVLILASPISVIANGEDVFDAASFDNVSRIQLTSRSVKLSPIAGKTVHLIGELFQGHTGHHYTDVLMMVESADVVN